MCSKLLLPMPRQVRLVGPVVAFAGKLDLPAGHSFQQGRGVAGFVEAVRGEQQQRFVRGNPARPINLEIGDDFEPGLFVSDHTGCKVDASTGISPNSRKSPTYHPAEQVFRRASGARARRQ